MMTVATPFAVDLHLAHALSSDILACLMLRYEGAPRNSQAGA